MNLRQLQYFVTIIEQSSFTAAASILHISQPSLSVAIKKLEHRVGLSLIDRSTRELTLTREGEILYEEAKKLITHFDHVSDEITRIRMEGPPELAIGIIESSKFWVPKILQQFKREYADVHLKLFEVLSLNDVIKALNNFDIHLAITNQYINSKDIQTIPIYEEKLVALLPLRHPLQAKSHLNINDLEGESFIISKEGFQTRADILNVFRKAGIKPNIQFELERLGTAVSLVENNLGITVVPENYINYSKKKLYHIKEIYDSNIARTVYLAYDKNRYLPPLVLRYISLVKEFFHDKQTDKQA